MYAIPWRIGDKEKEKEKKRHVQFVGKGNVGENAVNHKSEEGNKGRKYTTSCGFVLSASGLSVRLAFPGVPFPQGRKIKESGAERLPQFIGSIFTSLILQSRNT